jgi:hypothetical protein
MSLNRLKKIAKSCFGIVCYGRFTDFSSLVSTVIIDNNDFIQFFIRMLTVQMLQAFTYVPFAVVGADNN